MSIFTAQPETLDQIWPHALPHLKRFSEETLLVDIDAMYEKLKSNDRQMWLIERNGEVVLVVVTEVRDADRGPVCCIKIATGTAGHDALREICDEIERWAGSIGCAALEIYGRKGWAKVLDGFKQTGVILEKDIRQVH